ncbi:branched-chain amino acid aminotransferase [Corynebacterium aquatimens]|uniref:branched-chain-amino-acid transaminase n=1 Tax=Corynebacterium aquatimens TaxID=1190508 RepID=A0A931DXA5_9CORY|nr:branched-chain amino acid aminotransferase [Corynebacterium aquatimens]MBG6121997.1 branched-chain amino acid aminotransferase [Corynebacterium aquatimens]WJY65464.1 Branched-chain-amino-acid aminotransferase [Corynebacterium aquatimens]
MTDATDFTVTTNPNPATDAQIAEVLADPKFGNHFTDHMVSIDWTADKGWHNAQVRPYEALSCDPASMVFHYGQAIFEGLKAYRHADGSIVAFRPEQNAQRMQASARRLAMPEIPEDLFIEAVRQLVDVDQRWVPEAGGEASLYLRPFMIATEIGLGVHPANSYTFFVIASPAGAYFKGGVKPVKVWVSDEYVRAAPGGTGAAKFAGNYAASLAAQAAAEEQDCDQVVWLDAVERRYIEEMGGMNLMFVYGSEGGEVTVVTPQLSGSLLPGITRDSLLQVARDLGYETKERLISYEQWRDDVASGAMTESFACGTAAVITPVGHVVGKELDFTVNDNKAGDVTMKMRERLTAIQRGEAADEHGWIHALVTA